MVLVTKYFTEKLILADLIKSISRQYNLRWCIVAAIAWQESALDPNAEGDDGKSIGLMQIQLTTAEWMKGGPVTKDELKIPSVNIDYGCRYLRYQLDRYDQDYNKAISAYNAGTYYEVDPGIPRNNKYVMQVINGTKAIESFTGCQ
jgi:soluble lytic murein transglycosylase-like protein